ncbi:MAG: hypothetical protein ACK5JH_14760 [Anaerocolumna sp.]
MSRLKFIIPTKLNVLFKMALLSTLCILFILSFILKVTAAEEKDIEISVNYGFDQSVKYGRYIPVNITIKNHGEDFLGTVMAYASKVDYNVAYEKEIKVQGNETLEVTMTIPVLDNSGYLYVKVFDQHKHEIINNVIALQFDNYDKLMYVGVLSDKFDALDYLNLYGAKVFALDQTVIPEDKLGLDLLDVLVINQYESTDLNESQVEAILEWVEEGGNLVLGTGEYEQEVLSAFSKELGISALHKDNSLTFTFGTDKGSLKNLSGKILDYEENRRVYLENIKSQNKMLASYGLKPFTTIEPQRSLWTKEELNKLNVDYITKTVSKLQISGGFDVATYQGEQLFTTKLYGQGKIEIFHFDLGLLHENKATGLSILTAIRSNISDTKKSLLENEMYGAYWINDISSYISHAFDGRKPNILYYTLAIILYVIITGPILYVVLKKIDKSNWYYRSIMVLSLVFMGIIYLMGQSTRIGKPYIDLIKVSTYGEKETLVNHLYFSITGNSNRDFEVTLSKDFDVKEIAQTMPFITDYQVLKNTDSTTINSTITYKEDETKVKLTGLPAFTPLSYQFAYKEAAENKMSESLTNVGGGVKGTVKNTFQFDINHGILIANGYIVSLGNIKAGEEISLSDKYVMFVHVRDELYQEGILEKLTQTSGMYEESEGNRLNYVLQYFIEKEISNLGQGSYIIGLKSSDVEANSKEANPKEANSKEANTENETYEEVNSEHETLGEDIMADLSREYDVYATEVVKVPVDVDYSTKIESFVPSIDPYLISNMSYYNKYYQARYLNLPETILTYQFPEDDNIIRFTYLTNQNTEINADYLNKFTGTISFFNVKTEEFDAVFVNNYSESVKNPEDYLTENNSLTVRFSSDVSVQSYNTVLPNISYWKEANDARN